MEKPILFILLITISFLLGTYFGNNFDGQDITGNYVLTTENLNLLNCEELESFRICDVQYPNGTIMGDYFKEEIK